MSESSWWSRVWADTTVAERWSAFREFRSSTGGTLSKFMALGPYVRCSWLGVP